MPRRCVMMQRWGAEALRFMQDASAYGEYHARLVQRLLPYLPRDGHVCDAGCGLGHLALELAKCCKLITAVDCAQAPLQVLHDSNPPENLRIRHGDIFSMQASYDAMIFCYFGKTEEILHLAKEQCRGTMLVVKRDCSQHRFSLGEVQRKPHSIELLSDTLQGMGISYQSERISLELGQPFRSIEDAVHFFALYNKSEMEVRVQDIEPLLIETKESQFPYYLPSRRDMELIVFSAKDVKV